MEVSAFDAETEASIDHSYDTMDMSVSDAEYSSCGDFM